MHEQDAVECKVTESGEMQTVVSSYVTQNLIRQDRLEVHYPEDSYTEYHYGEDVDRASSPDSDEKINVDDEDKDELVIADDDVSEKNEVELKEDGVEDKEHKNDSNEREESGEPSWHPHVYGKPPKKPTPHTIEYILGLSKNREASKEEPKRVVSQLINVKRNFDRKPFSCQEKGTQVQNLSDRKFSLSVHKNKLQEQLLQRGVRTNDSEYDKVFKSEEQPLNLSVPKSKDSSGWSSSAEEDKFSKG